jgi:formylglycine-generating enzyme required for sulfatase activity
MRFIRNPRQRILLGLGVMIGLSLQTSSIGSAPSPTDMVLVPEGPFQMGSNERLPDEGPAHTVYLPSFYIDKYEVTNAQYEPFVKTTHRKPPLHWQGPTSPKSIADHPVVFVTWFDANDYCHWAGKRLPTAVEWEKAARGTDGRVFPWGNQFDPKKANTPYSKRGTTTPVGSFPSGRSPYGLFDMSGNVWEWTASWYKAYPGNKKRRVETYGERYRVVKGGSFVDCSFYKCGISAPTFNRAFFKPEVKNQGFGFRCAQSQ